MEIKILALLSILPLTRTLLKIRHREHLTCVDLILFFHSIYFVGVPLIGNQRAISYSEVRESSYIHWMTFLVYNAFAFTLVFFDTEICRRHLWKKSIYHFTKYIQDISSKIQPGITLLVIVWFVLALELFGLSTAIAWQSNIQDGSIEQIRNAMSVKRTPLLLFITGGMHTMRLLVVFFSFILLTNIKKNLRYKKIVYGAIVIQIIIHLFISRTYLFETVFWLIILMYSKYRQKIGMKMIIKSSVVLVFCVSFVFPVITAFRAVNKSLVYQGSITNVFDIVSTGVDLALSGDLSFKGTDNREDRMWNVYQIVAYAYSCDYEGYGEIITNAISYGIPKIIYPDKSEMGSQGIIEKETRLNSDVADSVLLAGVMESRVLGFALAVFFFIFLIWLHDSIVHMFCRHFHNVLTIPLVLSNLFIWLNRIEYGIDFIINNLIQLILWNMFLFIAIIMLRKILPLPQIYSK